MTHFCLDKGSLRMAGLTTRPGKLLIPFPSPSVPPSLRSIPVLIFLFSFLSLFEFALVNKAQDATPLSYMSRPPSPVLKY